MPSQTVQSVLGNKPLSKRILESRDKPPVPDSGGGLPGGIENGIAKLISCKIQKIGDGKQNAGKPIFMARGVVVAPDKHDGVPVKGRQTSIIESLFDTPGKARATFDDHIDWVVNMLKCLGADTTRITVASDIDQVCADLTELAPHFSFRTWKGSATPQYPNPRVNETWGSMVEYEEEPGAATAGADDHTGTDETGVADEAEETAPEEPEPDATEDLDELAKVADAKKDSKAKEDAGDRLTAIAKERGVAEDDVASAANWAAVVELINAAGGEGEGEEAADEAPAEEEFVPAKGEVYGYLVLDPKTKKPVIDPKTKKAKPKDVEVVAVDAKTKTVTAKFTDTGKAVAGPDGKTGLKVPFDQLIAS